MHLYSNRENIALASRLEDISAAKIALLGVPFDSTETNIPGQRFAPWQIRAQILREDIQNIYDAGDIDVVFGNAKKTLMRTEETLREIFEKNKAIKPVLLGGEHTITYAAVKALKEYHKDLQVVALDAHYDLYNDYVGEKWSHATVLRRVHELKVDLKIIGVREKNESARKFAERNKIGLSIDSINPLLPTYVSIDIDFFDPKIAPGVGDPEARGFGIDAFKKTVERCKNIVGADIVEFNPMVEREKTNTVLDDIVKCILSTLK